MSLVFDEETGYYVTKAGSRLREDTFYLATDAIDYAMGLRDDIPFDPELYYHRGSPPGAPYEDDGHGNYFIPHVYLGPTTIYCYEDMIEEFNELRERQAELAEEIEEG
jgi:hypothetical protein